MDLKGKRIIIPPPVEIQRGSFYTTDVLSKLKFEEKFEYNELVYGDTLTVTDVQHLNIGDKKNEMVLVHLTHKGKPIVLYLPLFIKRDDKRIYRNFYGKGKTEVGFTSVSEVIPFESIFLHYYDADIIDRINNDWLNHLVYPRKTEFPKVRGKYRFETDRMNELEPYLFLGFEFADIDQNNDKFESLYAIFSNRNGIHHYLPIKVGHINGNSYGHILQDFTNSFYSDMELKAHCEQNRNDALIDSITHKYIGTEVFINKSTLEANTSERAFNLASSGGFLHNWGDGYFQLTGIRMLPSYSHKPFYKYFAIASNSGNEFAIPIDSNFFLAVEDASSHRAEIEAENLRAERERAAQEAEWARQEREEQAALARKYGSANAKLISEGSIRLGFTKAMVRESWGSPYDTMTVSNNYGSVECWIYGLGSYVYFQGNKVVQIIN